MKRALALAAAAAISLTACAAPSAEHATSSPAPANMQPTGDNYDQRILDLAWDQMSMEDQYNICEGWDTLGHEWVIDYMRDTMPDISRQSFYNFFSEVC